MKAYPRDPVVHSQKARLDPLQPPQSHLLRRYDWIPRVCFHLFPPFSTCPWVSPGTPSTKKDICPVPLPKQPTVFRSHFAPFSRHSTWLPYLAFRRDGFRSMLRQRLPLTYPRDPSTFSAGDWRHRYVGLEGPVVPSEVRYDWIPRDTGRVGFFPSTDTYRAWRSPSAAAGLNSSSSSAGASQNARSRSAGTRHARCRRDAGAEFSEPMVFDGFRWFLLMVFDGSQESEMGEVPNSWKTLFQRTRFGDGENTHGFVAPYSV